MSPPRIIRDFSLRSWGAYASLGLQLARGILLARLLSPADFGLVALIGIVVAYSMYADIGLSSAVARQLPVAIGAGDGDSVRMWRWYALFFKLVAEIALAGILVAYVLAGWSSLHPDMRFGLLTAAVVCILQGVVVAQQTIFDSTRQFARSAALLTALFGLNLIAGVLGATLIGTQGVFLGQVIAFAVAAGIGVTLGGWPTPEPLRRTHVKSLARIGIPLAVLNISAYALVYLDQVMVAGLLGQSSLGTYMIVLYVGAAIGALPLALGGVVSPLLMERYGAVGTVDSIGDYTWRPVRALSLALPPLIALTWVVAPACVALLLPLYAGSIAPMRIYLTGLFFFCLNLGVGSTLLAINKHLFNIPIVAACIGVNVGLDMLFVGRLAWGLEGIALGSAVTYFAYWMAHTVLVRRYFGQRAIVAFAKNMESGWPGIMLAGLATLAWYYGYLDSSQPFVELLYITPVLAVTLVRLMWARTPDPARAKR